MTDPGPIVDAHQHFQDFAANRHPWLSDRDRPPPLEGDLEPIRHNYLPDDYRRDAAGFDVRQTVHVENGWDPADPVGETRWLAALADRTGLPTAIVAAANLAAPDLDAVLEGHLAASPAVRGVRQILNWHEEPRLRVADREDLMETAAWRRGLARLRPLGLSFDLHLFWPQLAMAARLARAMPETSFVLNHFGVPMGRDADRVAAWSAGLTDLARAPNVTVKLSAFGLGHPGWTQADTVPLLTRVIEIFGPDRVMVGTNLPVDRLFAEGRQILETCVAATAGLSAAERRAVLSGTAERVYRI